MSQAQKKVVLVMVNLRPGIDGGATAMLELMPSIRRLGFQAAVFNFITGDPPHRALLAARMISRGHEPTACEEDIYLYREGGVECQVRFLPFTIDDLRSDKAPILKVLTSELRHLQADYVLTADRLSLLAVHLLGMPGCHIFHSLGNIQRVQSMHPAYLSSIRQRDCAAVSSYLQGQVKEMLGLDASVLPPGLDFRSYAAPRGPEAEAVGFYAAGHPGYKGDEVVAAVIEALPEQRFVVVGRNFRHHFEAFPENLNFLGFQQDMREFYRRLKILLVPSLVPEGFPRIILEAAANGIPILANNIGGIAEALEDAGILIEINAPGEPVPLRLAERYVKEIQKLFADPPLYAALSRKARDRAHRYEKDMEKTLKAFLEAHIT